MSRLLLLSNSTEPGKPFFNWASDYVQDFFGKETDTILFIPYAGIRISYETYAGLFGKAMDKLGYRVLSIHDTEDPVAAVKEAQAIAVGGGNTFRLISLLYEQNLIEAVRDKVNNGTPYMGWSAGSNITCPTIMTTNDMPVVEPPSLKALNLVPFQINPHYTDQTISGHGGESRSDRLNEFIELNRDVKVAGLPEGSLLEVQGDAITLKGGSMSLFEYGKDVQEFEAGTVFSKDLTVKQGTTVS